LVLGFLGFGLSFQYRVTGCVLHFGPGRDAFCVTLVLLERMLQLTLYKTMLCCFLQVVSKVHGTTPFRPKTSRVFFNLGLTQQLGKKKGKMEFYPKLSTLQPKISPSSKDPKIVPFVGDYCNDPLFTKSVSNYI
jgi:hypothetical protein